MAVWVGQPGGGALAGGDALLESAMTKAAVVAIAQRLEQLAAELAGLQARTVEAGVLDWQSAAGSAFRERVSGHGAELARTARELRGAVASIQAYAAALDAGGANLPGLGAGLGYGTSSAGSAFPVWPGSAGLD